MKIMAVDLGDARTGLAVCDRTEFLASPIGTVEERRFDVLVQKVAYMAKQYEVEEIVVGLPLNMNGSKGPRAEKAELFANVHACYNTDNVAVGAAPCHCTGNGACFAFNNNCRSTKVFGDVFGGVADVFSEGILLLNISVNIL